MPNVRWNWATEDTEEEEVRAEESNLSRSQVSNLIDEYIFKERDRAILKRRLLDGVVYEQLAEEFDMSDRQIKRIVYKLQERVFRHVKR